MEEEKENVKKVTIASDDLYILVLMPALKSFGVQKPLEIEIAGKSIESWVEDAVSAFPYRRIDVGASDDIISLIKKHQTPHKYTMVIYGDIPLLTRASIEGALGFAKMFEHKAVRMPRGWLFESDYIKTTNQISTTDIPHLDPEDFIAVYNWAQLERASKVMQRRINSRHMANGVRIVDSVTTYIDHDVDIEKNVTIEQGTIIKGKTQIKSGSKIGPYAHIRDGVTSVGKNCKIGNFVELKNANIGDGTKISHLTYVGDATIGRDCNLGCGVVFCNYDGEKKHHTILGDNVFVGSNVNFVSPIKVSDKAVIAAGSTITEDVCEDCLAIARPHQTNKPEYTKKKLIAKAVVDNPQTKPPIKNDNSIVDTEIQKLKQELFELRAEIVTARQTIAILPTPSQAQEEETIFAQEIRKARTPRKTETLVIEEDDNQDLIDGIELNEAEEESLTELIIEGEDQKSDLHLPANKNSLTEEAVDFSSATEIINSVSDSDDCLVAKIEEIEQDEQQILQEDEDDDEYDDGVLKVFKIDGDGQEIQEEELDDDSADTIDENYDTFTDSFDEMNDETLPLLKGKFDWDNPDGDIEEFYQGRD